MLIIFEGLDKSGKSMLAKITKELLDGVLIKKQYADQLNPVNFTEASLYDWQALLDRVILANPDLTFVADRSFITQTVYQSLLGSGEHACRAKHIQAYNAYVETVKRMPHLVVYCESDMAYELDSMVTSLAVRQRLHQAYKQAIKDTGLNRIIVHTDRTPLAESIGKIVSVATSIINGNEA